MTFLASTINTLSLDTHGHLPLMIGGNIKERTVTVMKEIRDITREDGEQIAKTAIRKNNGKKQVSIRLLRELYRVDNKYWKTGDIDILPKRTELAEAIDSRFWSEIAGIARILTQKRLSVDTFAKCLELLGYEIVEDENDTPFENK